MTSILNERIEDDLLSKHPEMVQLENVVYRVAIPTREDFEALDALLQIVEKEKEAKEKQVEELQLKPITKMFIGGLAAYLTFGYFAPLFCKAIGFGYPAYMSVKAVRSETKADDTMWLKYWTVFGCLAVIDSFARGFMHYFPGYYLAKACFLIYLYHPQTFASIEIYDTYADNIVNAIDHFILSRVRGIMCEEVEIKNTKAVKTVETSKVSAKIVALK